MNQITILENIERKRKKYEDIIRKRVEHSLREYNKQLKTKEENRANNRLQGKGTKARKRMEKTNE